MVASAQDAIREEDGRPLFLFVNLMAAHAPYSVVPEVPWSARHAEPMRDPERAAWLKTYGADRDPPALALSPGARWPGCSRFQSELA